MVAFVAAVAVVGFMQSAEAQTPSTRNGAGKSALPAVGGAAAVPSMPVIPTLQSLRQAAVAQDYSLVQLRRFRSDQGNVVAVRENLQVDANGTSEPAFALAFVGVEGELPGSPVSLKWQQTYARYGAMFFSYSSFRIRDVGRAQVNYTIHDFGPVHRAGRAARRMVVFPQSGDKAVWVIDVDDQTEIVLYSAEFDTQMRLLAEVEVLSFTAGVSSQSSGGLASIANGATVMADFVAAKTFLGDPAGLIDPNVMVASDYSLERIEVRDDPLNGQQKLVMSYTDGIDQFVVVQAPGSADFFSGLPGKTTQSSGHTIARYRDPAMSVLLFWDDGIAFHVAGRGSLRRLDEVARRIYIQALSTH